jgi:predicted lipid-binding transport protein (Tim44 family)
MKNARWLAVVAALIVLAPSVAPPPAEARAGAGSSSGSRGGKTGQAPAPTQTAPTSKPVERSTTPTQKPAAAAPVPAQSGSFMARNPFLSGLMGGMLGAGLIGMMFGGGFTGGLGGAAGMLGLLVQLLLIGGLAYLAVRLWRARSGAQAQPVQAYAGPAAPPRPGDVPMARLGLAGGGAALAGSASPQLAITTDDYTAFETLLADVQSAYSKGDLAKMRSLATPEMLGYFSEELAANASRGVENRIEAVKLEQGDLSEAWSEAGLDYATVAMRFSMIDVTRTIADGKVVAGSDTERTEATEIWTFLRSRGGKWILSAIQQI